MTRLAVLAAILVATLGASPPLRGIFALQDATAKTRGYLVASPLANDPATERLDFWLTRRTSNAPLLDYDAEMTKLLHTIVVSDDFGTFAHVHATFGADGHFRIAQRFPKPGLYHVYEDATPHAFGQQVFRFDVAAGGGPVDVRGGGDVGMRRRLVPTGPVARAGPYEVVLDRTTVPATAGVTREATLTVHVRENGKAAADLHPYLGALAHAVFLNADDLTYVHVHPLPLDAETSSTSRTSGMAGMPGMAGMSAPALPASAVSSPDMQLHVALHEPGIYKLWLEFRGGSALRVATFVLRAT